MESIIVIVGFLGAGKTTLLKQLIQSFADAAWEPFVILNDYANANLDSEQLADNVSPSWVRALNGSCICCDGINELRESVNSIPFRERGVTLIEANGTSDACRLMGFLGVGLDERFTPPIQVSVVDVKNWQQRGLNNELEANQVQISSLIILTHLDKVSEERVAEVKDELKKINPFASIVDQSDIDALLLPNLKASESSAIELDHDKTHWASCSIDLPSLPNLRCLKLICDSIPDSVLRVKGCTKVGKATGYTYFERCPDGEVYVRPYRGIPSTGPKLVTVGPGSNPAFLEKLLEENSV
jgi:G3E family GTPase